MAEGRRLKTDAELIEKVAAGEGLFTKFQPFVGYVAERERVPSAVRPLDAALASFGLLERYSLFACAEEETDDAPLD